MSIVNQKIIICLVAGFLMLVLPGGLSANERPKDFSSNVESYQPIKSAGLLNFCKTVVDQNGYTLRRIEKSVLTEKDSFVAILPPGPDETASTTWCCDDCGTEGCTGCTGGGGPVSCPTQWRVTCADDAKDCP